MSTFHQTINILSRYTATLGPLGYMPAAPGTFGSALAFVAMLLLRPDDLTLVAVIIPLGLIGVMTSGIAEKELGNDSRNIVLDEFVGYLLAVVLVPKRVAYLFAALVLFRIFDIVKPPPIRRIEKTVKGGAGVMLDDVVAALYANVILQVFIHVTRAG